MKISLCFANCAVIWLELSTQATQWLQKKLLHHQLHLLVGNFGLPGRDLSQLVVACVCVRAHKHSVLVVDDVPCAQVVAVGTRCCYDKLQFPCQASPCLLVESQVVCVTLPCHWSHNGHTLDSRSPGLQASPLHNSGRTYRYKQRQQATATHIISSHVKVTVACKQQVRVVLTQDIHIRKGHGEQLLARTELIHKSLGSGKRGQTQQSSSDKK